MGQKTALVTGSSNGIGEAIVKRLAALDYKLVVTGRSEADVERVASECALLSPSQFKPLSIVADLELESDTERLARQTLEHFDNKLSLLVNNAGFGQPVPHTQPEACYESYKRTMQVNLNSIVYLTTMASGALQRAAEEAKESSSVIMISSIAGLRPTISLSAYSVSKAAMNMYASSMAIELAPLIRVNCISPGPIETKIIERSGFSMEHFKSACRKTAPLERIGSADEVAELALFLADHKKSAFITGANITVDGGCLMVPLKWTD